MELRTRLMPANIEGRFYDLAVSAAGDALLPAPPAIPNGPIAQRGKFQFG